MLSVGSAESVCVRERETTACYVWVWSTHTVCDFARYNRTHASTHAPQASSPSSRVRIDPPLSSSPPTRRALSPNARSRAAEDLLPPPPSRVAPTLVRSLALVCACVCMSV